jgi:hypothetical protein
MMMVVNDVWERKWKDAVMACFGIKSHHLSGITNENHKNLSYDRPSSQVLNLGSKEYEAEMPTTQRYSVTLLYK